MNSYVKGFLEIANYIFAFVFNIELILKLISDGFDFFIVISADVGIMFDLLELNGSFKSLTTVFRALRILRIAKLLK
jgi:voltage-gated sodium channel